MTGASSQNELELPRRYGGVALVTGAAQGIGRAFSERLAAVGCDVLLVDRDRERLETLAKEVEKTHRVAVEPVVCDLTRSDLQRCAADWARRFDVGILVNNAGISPMDLFFDVPLEAHLETLDLNCRATLILTHEIGRAMVRRGRGAIVIVSSASAMSGAPFFAHYAATKGYGLNLGVGLWSELREHGIDVLVTCPGLTDTPPVKTRGLDRTAPFFVPVNRPEEVARSALGALGRQPVVVPALLDRMSSGLLSRAMPRSWALGIIRRSLARLMSGSER